MITPTQFAFAAAPIVPHGFDALDDGDTTYGAHIKCPSLEDYDHSNHEDGDADILLGLDRWGDKRMPR